MRIGVPTGVINGFDFVAMDIHKSLACEKKRRCARELRETRRKYERQRERQKGKERKEGRRERSLGLLLDLGAAAGSKDVKHEKKAERWKEWTQRGRYIGICQFFEHKGADEQWKDWARHRSLSIILNTSRLIHWDLIVFRNILIH